MDLIARPWMGEPRQWTVVFDRRAATWWMNKAPIGKYKHVRAFGYVPEAKAWIFYDVSLDRTTIRMACDQDAMTLMGEWLAKADAILMPVVDRGFPPPRLGFWCVPAIKHLIGLRSGALRPQRLWDDCLRAGGEIVAHEAGSTDLRGEGRSVATASGCPGQS